ncbi:MAG: DUF1824 family protein [Cyanobacteria bacterium P01_C01_bin.73]
MSTNQDSAEIPSGGSREVTPQDLRSQRRMLLPYSRFDCPPTLDASTRSSICQVLQTFDQLADYETLGVCAEDLDSARVSLEAYLRAFGITVSLKIPERSGSVYLKFNTLNGQWYLDSYTGRSRGVLVTFHASDAEEIGGTYGPFPLDLFD